MDIPPFVLYGLVGCPHCGQSEIFLQKLGVKYWVFVVNEDPIADAGIIQITGKPEYPVLLYKPTKEIVVGFKPKEYERLSKHLHSIIGASTNSISDSQ